MFSVQYSHWDVPSGSMELTGPSRTEGVASSLRSEVRRFGFSCEHGTEICFKNLIWQKWIDTVLTRILKSRYWIESMVALTCLRRHSPTVWVVDFGKNWFVTLSLTSVVETVSAAHCLKHHRHLRFIFRDRDHHHWTERR